MEPKVGLLKHQLEFALARGSDQCLLTGGYRAGKTVALCLRAILLSAENIGCTGLMLSPIASMANDVLLPELFRQLDLYKGKVLSLPGLATSQPVVLLGYKAIRTPLPYIDLYFKHGTSKILIRSAENHRRLVGLSLAWFCVDELDTIKQEIAEVAWRTLMSRLSEGVHRCGNAATTPEGFGFCYQHWVQGDSPGRLWVKAKTMDNIFLPDGYIEMLRSQFPPHLIEAYINGEFVNITEGVVYRNYNRVLNRSSLKLLPGVQLHIGMDFNVGNMAAAVAHFVDGKLHFISEITKEMDTPAMIQAIRSRFPEHVRNGLVTIYPDASSSKRSSADATLSDLNLLRQEGFRIKVDASNPRVRDRVLSLDTGFKNANGKMTVLVNDSGAPTLANSLEQQTWDGNEPDKKKGIEHILDSAGYVTSKLLSTHIRQFSGVPTMTTY